MLVKGEEKAERPVGRALRTGFKRKEGRGIEVEGRLLCQPPGFLSTSKLNTQTLLNGAVRDKCDHKEPPLHTHEDGPRQKTRQYQVAGRDVETLEPWCAAGENVKWYSCYGK